MAEAESAMQHVDVRDFEAHPTRYLFGNRKVSVEQDGRPIGYFLPVPHFSIEERREAMARWEETVERLKAETGMSEDELADLFDLNRPFPYPLEAPVHASGR